MTPEERAECIIGCDGDDIEVQDEVRGTMAYGPLEVDAAELVRRVRAAIAAAIRDAIEEERDSVAHLYTEHLREAEELGAAREREACAVLLDERAAASDRYSRACHDEGRPDDARVFHNIASEMRTMAYVIRARGAR